jgi:recombination protein RecA
VPRGRIIELFGAESSGKTSLALRILVNYRQNFPDDKRPIVIIDIERTILTSLITSMGGSAKDIVFMYPDTAEEALESWRRLNASGQVAFILLDSIDGLQSSTTLKKKIGEADMQGIAKMVGTAIREISKTSIENHTTNILINQIRDTMDAYGPKSTTPGGKAIRFYSSVRIETMKQQESTNVKDAFLMRAKVVKNKCGPPHAEPTDIDFVYGVGPDPCTDLLNFAKKVGCIRFASSAVYYNKATGEVKLDCKASAGFLNLIKENQALHLEIRERAFDLFKNKVSPETVVVVAEEAPSDEELVAEVAEASDAA